MLVDLDEKCGDLCLRLLEKLHTIYVTTVGCSIFHPANFKQTISPQHVPLQRESLIDGTVVTIMLCLHILITHHIFINF